MKIKVCVVPCDERDPYETEIEQGDIDAMQALVGGLFAPVDIDNVRTTLWCNEEGILLRLPFNELATFYLLTNAPEHIGVTMIVGDCFFTGLPDEEGDTTSVPDHVISFFTN